MFYEDAPWQPENEEEGRHHGWHKIGPLWYKPKEGTELVQAATWENPFISEEYYAQLKSLYSTSFAEQELEGQFVDVLGLMFKREWFAGKIRDSVPRKAKRVRYWDLAATDFDGCYTSGALLAMTDNGEVYVENITRGQWSTMVRNMMIKETADRDSRRYGNEVYQVFEQEPGSGGKEQAQQMVRMLAGMPVFRDIPSRGKSQRTDHGEKLPGAAKVYRAQPFSAQCEAGNVYLQRADWNDEWLSEVTAFPEMKICDQVDSTGACYNYLAKSKVPVPGDIVTVSGASEVTNKYGQRATNRMDLELPTFVGRN